MSELAGDPLPGLSVWEAARAKGVSARMVRRWCATGRVRSHRFGRDSVQSLRVYLDESSDRNQPPRKGLPNVEDGQRRTAAHAAEPSLSLAAITPSSQNLHGAVSHSQREMMLVAAREMRFLTAVTAGRRLVARQAIMLRDQAELVDQLVSARDQARVTIS
jgi:hypothetical protein